MSIIKNVRVKSARITEPNDNDKYQLIFAIDDDDVREELIDLINNDWDENGTKKKADNLAYFTSESNDDYPDDEDTGTTIFIATRNATTQKGVEQSVPVFKKNGTQYEEIPNIGKGTIINLSTDPYTWEYKRNAGTKLNLNKIQILDLVEWSGGDSFDNESDEKFDGVEVKKEKKKKKKSKK